MLAAFAVPGSVVLTVLPIPGLCGAGRCFRGWRQGFRPSRSAILCLEWSARHNGDGHRRTAVLARCRLLWRLHWRVLRWPAHRSADCDFAAADIFGLTRRLRFYSAAGRAGFVTLLLAKLGFDPAVIGGFIFSPVELVWLILYCATRRVDRVAGDQQF